MYCFYCIHNENLNVYLYVLTIVKSNEPFTTVYTTLYGLLQDLDDRIYAHEVTRFESDIKYWPNEYVDQFRNANKLNYSDNGTVSLILI